MRVPHHPSRVGEHRPSPAHATVSCTARIASSEESGRGAAMEGLAAYVPGAP
ncbi:MAG: hypothetical protein IT374_03545 [Polyangiaceae bacterium]|nr:hypothetical protein [Polyangiaceae bacterium]